MKKYAFSAIFIIGTHFESIFKRFLGLQKEKWGAKKAWRKAPDLYGKYNDRLLALTFFIFFNLTKQRIYAKIYTLFKGIAHLFSMQFCSG